MEDKCEQIQKNTNQLVLNYPMSQTTPAYRTLLNYFLYRSFQKVLDSLACALYVLEKSIKIQDLNIFTKCANFLIFDKNWLNYS